MANLMITEQTTETTAASKAADISTEISELKEKYGNNCRVIQNIGEFTHVITISVKEQDIKLKFQISGGYPAIPAEVVVSGGADVTESLPSDLYQFLQEAKQAVSSVSEYVEMAHEWLSDKTVVSKDVKTSCSPKKKKTRKCKTAQVNDDSIGEKKPSMKTAEDVIKRILWDSHLCQEDFTIGYVDRFLGLMEKSFTAFSWEDIASVDDFTALAIPKHRIQYFKFRGIVVWDKVVRLDNVFGSTGSGLTISDVKEQLDASDASGAVTSETVQNSREQSDSDSDDFSSNDSDDEYDVVVGLGDFRSQSNNPRSSSAPLTFGECDLNNRKRPNHFICVRITSPDIIANVKATQSTVGTIDPRLVKCFANPITLHMTLCTLGLDTDYQVRNACQALSDCRQSLAEIVRRRLTFTVAGVDHFYARVVYAKVRQSVLLDEFVTCIRQAMNDAGVDIRDGYDFVPHVTLMKLSKGLDTVVGVSRLPPFTHRNFRDTEFGVQQVTSIDLCTMTNERSDTGFYVTPLHMELLADDEVPANGGLETTN